MNAVYKWGWFGGANTDCGCDDLYAAYFGTGLLLSYLVRCALCPFVSRAISHESRPLQFLFIEFFIATYKRGAARRRKARTEATKKKHS
jgi:hypothetical protein